MTTEVSGSIPRVTRIDERAKRSERSKERISPREQVGRESTLEEQSAGDREGSPTAARARYSDRPRDSFKTVVYLWFDCINWTHRHERIR